MLKLMEKAKMRMSKIHWAPFLLLTVFIVLLNSNSARADIQTFTNQLDWNLQIIDSSIYFQDFSTLDNPPVYPPDEFSGNGFLYAVTSPGGLYTATGFGSLSTNSSADPIEIMFLGLNLPTAVGGNFFSADASGIETGNTIMVTAVAGAETASLTFDSSQLDTFAGFLSPGNGFTSLSIFIPTSASNFGADFPSMTSLTVASAAVPEPASIVLLCTGLGVIGLAKRWKK